jgi:hypothetical protein
VERWIGPGRECLSPHHMIGFSAPPQVMAVVRVNSTSALARTDARRDHASPGLVTSRSVGTGIRRSWTAVLEQDGETSAQPAPARSRPTQQSPKIPDAGLWSRSASGGGGPQPDRLNSACVEGVRRGSCRHALHRRGCRFGGRPRRCGQSAPGDGMAHPRCVAASCLSIRPDWCSAFPQLDHS